MKIEVGFGEGTQCVEINDDNILQILTANEHYEDEGGPAVVRAAMNSPIASKRLKEIVKPGEKIAIITSDISRPMPTSQVLPIVLEELYEAGVSREDITVVFALGSHRHHSSEEMKRLAGDGAFGQVRCVDSDPDDCIHMGRTSRGTPVEISRVVAEADRRIALGNIEYHYFAGYSGGAKAIMPGVSTPAAIQVNHSMMINPRACAGNIADNPIRQDIEEAAELCPADFIVNVVLDEHKHIIYAVAGDMTETHRAGCRFLDSLYHVEIHEKAQIVISSQGGLPKDVTLYQTQKALDNAKYAIREGGTIILVGSCREGMGSRVFEEWMEEADKPEDLTRRIKEEFVLGGHKAAAIAMILEKANIKLVSDMDPEMVRNAFMEPYRNLEEAYADALKEQGADASVIVMPAGGSTLPIYK